MPNERLRAALLERGMTPADLADAVGVDTKSVERWISLDRTPYRRHRYAAAARLGMDETYLWPKALSAEQSTAASGSEIIEVHPHRWTVPRDAWKRLFESAEREISILVFSGFFLAEDASMHRLLAEKARSGVRVRILLGDPDSEAVAQRGADEGIDDSMAAKIRNVIVLYKPLRAVDGVEFRLHGTILYNSIYRADDQMLVNTHVYGAPASFAPVFHLRKIPGGSMVNTYLDSFEKAWDRATPLD
ncbi:XRE family transcriptional regulator [Marinitenerispora sediminis]|uniref:XRE family transcriptional regulator n=1 Tax=Marinitenerispora sediminis TaxID=1931232 RepID=A0A368T4L5_9ACTN|nr:XRE family transcriptional regulator [Marinitenerispora sediminis]RCV49833.1 XRE family transcriptional regulator [Marinitenerispora sediminis]RCV53921.1 XRE family transcriptional regulator [Marinitenerispora sediminis]RCV58393.1 XRE family transcriptional regulator [Marinitenerispora sediminis]